MVDDAVWWEPVSVSNTPDHHGKYREFRRFWLSLNLSHPRKPRFL